MTKLLNVLAGIVGVVIALFIIWGGTELICEAFNIEDILAKAIIRLVVFAGFFILVSLLQKKISSRE